MYEARFGLASPPFAFSPQVDRYVALPQFEDARLAVRRCVERGRGVALLIAPSGCGKTMLSLRVAADLGDEFRTVLLSGGRLDSPAALMQTLLHELEHPFAGVSEGEARLAVMDAAAPDFDPRPIALFVDEAQSLPFAVLDELRLLSNLAADGAPRIRMTFAGIPRLEERFASPALAPLAQRVAARSYLTPLGSEEVRRYVRERIASAGGDAAKLFDDAALTAIHAATDGVPRVVGQLGEHALQIAYEEDSTPLSAVDVEFAWADLQGLPTPSNVNPVEQTGDSGPVGQSDVEFADLSEEEPAEVGMDEAASEAESGSHDEREWERDVAFSEDELTSDPVRGADAYDLESEDAGEAAEDESSWDLEQPCPEVSDEPVGSVSEQDELLLLESSHLAEVSEDAEALEEVRGEDDEWGDADESLHEESPEEAAQPILESGPPAECEASAVEEIEISEEEEAAVRVENFGDAVALPPDDDSKCNDQDEQPIEVLAEAERALDPPEDVPQSDENPAGDDETPNAAPSVVAPEPPASNPFEDSFDDEEYVAARSAKLQSFSATQVVSVAGLTPLKAQTRAAAANERKSGELRVGESPADEPDEAASTEATHDEAIELANHALEFLETISFPGNRDWSGAATPLPEFDEEASDEAQASDEAEQSMSDAPPAIEFRSSEPTPESQGATISFDELSEEEVELEFDAGALREDAPREPEESAESTVMQITWDDIDFGAEFTIETDSAGHWLDDDSSDPQAIKAPVELEVAEEDEEESGAEAPASLERYENLFSRLRGEST